MTDRLNAAPPNTVCHECPEPAVTLCPWPIHHPGAKQAVRCDRPTCKAHGHLLVDRHGMPHLPGICLEHRNIVVDTRARREAIMERHRERQAKQEAPDAS